MESKILEFIFQNNTDTIHIVTDENGNIIAPTNLIVLQMVKEILKSRKKEQDSFFYAPTGNWYEYYKNSGIVDGKHLVVERLIDVTKYKQIEISLQYDAVTGLYNRKITDEKVNEYISRCLNNNEPFSIVVIDCDKFKEINDQYGHETGDIVLAKIANILSESIRNDDERETDIVGRNGGDEFLMLIKDIDSTVTEERLNQIRDTINTTNIIAENGETLPICHLSIGYYNVTTADVDNLYDDDLTSFRNKICRCSDQAMYYSKQHGGDQITNYRNIDAYIKERKMN